MKKSTVDALFNQEYRKLFELVNVARMEGKPLHNRLVVEQSQKVDLILNLLTSGEGLDQSKLG